MHDNLGDVDIFELVKQDLDFRNVIGYAQHNRRLTLAVEMDHLQELYEELLDACVYLCGLLAKKRLIANRLLEEDKSLE